MNNRKITAALVMSEDVSKQRIYDELVRDAERMLTWVDRILTAPSMPDVQKYQLCFGRITQLEQDLQDQLRADRISLRNQILILCTQMNNYFCERMPDTASWLKAIAEKYHQYCLQYCVNYKIHLMDFNPIKLYGYLYFLLQLNKNELIQLTPKEIYQSLFYMFVVTDSHLLINEDPDNFFYQQRKELITACLEENAEEFVEDRLQYEIDFKFKHQPKKQTARAKQLLEYWKKKYPDADIVEFGVRGIAACAYIYRNACAYFGKLLDETPRPMVIRVELTALCQEIIEHFDLFLKALLVNLSYIHANRLLDYLNDIHNSLSLYTKCYQFLTTINSGDTDSQCKLTDSAIASLTKLEQLLTTVLKPIATVKLLPEIADKALAIQKDLQNMSKIFVEFAQKLKQYQLDQSAAQAEPFVEAAPLQVKTVKKPRKHKKKVRFADETQLKNGDDVQQPLTEAVLVADDQQATVENKMATEPVDDDLLKLEVLTHQMEATTEAAKSAAKLAFIYLRTHKEFNPVEAQKHYAPFVDHYEHCVKLAEECNKLLLAMPASDKVRLATDIHSMVKDTTHNHLKKLRDRWQYHYQQKNIEHEQVRNEIIRTRPEFWFRNAEVKSKHTHQLEAYEDVTQKLSQLEQRMAAIKTPVSLDKYLMSYDGQTFESWQQAADKHDPFACYLLANYHLQYMTGVPIAQTATCKLVRDYIQKARAHLPETYPELSDKLNALEPLLSARENRLERWSIFDRYVAASTPWYSFNRTQIRACETSTDLMQEEWSLQVRALVG